MPKIRLQHPAEIETVKFRALDSTNAARVRNPVLRTTFQSSRVLISELATQHDCPHRKQLHNNKLQPAASGLAVKENLFHDASFFDASELRIEPLELIRESFVIDSQRM